MVPVQGPVPGLHKARDALGGGAQPGTPRFPPRRARPVVHVSRNVSLLPPNIDLEQSNCRHQEGVWCVPAASPPWAHSGGWLPRVLPPAPCPPSVDVQACFSYTASPASYSPRLGEQGDPRLRCWGTGTPRVGGEGPPPSRLSLCPPVLEYVFDADTERRRLGHPPRISFLGRQPSDPEHQFSDTLELPGQRARACTMATFQLQVGPRPRLHPYPVSSPLSSSSCPSLSPS